MNQPPWLNSLTLFSPSSSNRSTCRDGAGRPLIQKTISDTGKRHPAAWYSRGLRVPGLQQAVVRGA